MTKLLQPRYLLALGAGLMISLASGRGSVPPAVATGLTPAGTTLTPTELYTAPPQDGDTRTTVIRSTDTSASLADRVNWAKAEAGRKGFDKGYWVGYSIVREMGERSFIGSFYSEKRRNRPSLGELITGVQVETLPSVSDESFGSMSGTMHFDDDDEDEIPRRMVKKEVGLLFHVSDPGNMRSGEVGEMTVSNLSLRVDLDGDPLLWVGGAGYEESVTFLEGAFRKTADLEARKELIVAIGLHDQSKKAMGLLEDILTGSGDPELREDAAFWLGQKASDKSVAALKDLVYKDEETEVQRSAMFALTQVEDGGGVDELIKIARTHPNPKIRKDAIFWLGQSEDPKALDVLVDIVKGN